MFSILHIDHNCPLEHRIPSINIDASDVRVLKCRNRVREVIQQSGAIFTRDSDCRRELSSVCHRPADFDNPPGVARGHLDKISAILKMYLYSFTRCYITNDLIPRNRIATFCVTVHKAVMTAEECYPPGYISGRLDEAVKQAI